MKKGIMLVNMFMICLSLLCGCGGQAGEGMRETSVRVDEEAHGASTRAAGEMREANAQAEVAAVVYDESTVIDYSHCADGYVNVQYKKESKKPMKVLVKGPKTTYTYNLSANEQATFPLSDGDGTYQVSMFENVEGDRYAVVASASFFVTLTDEFAPFIRPNQYVDYENAPETVKKAEELAGEIAEPLKKVEAVYNYVVQNLTYDTEKAANVPSGYLPVLDTVLAEKKGICFDYAALMTGMLRSQNVPCKLVVGYAGTVYHAWINVWTEETGWIDGVIYFNGSDWHRLDPTFADSGEEDAELLEFIEDGTKYTQKYLY